MNTTNGTTSNQMYTEKEINTTNILSLVRKFKGCKSNLQQERLANKLSDRFIVIEQQIESRDNRAHRQRDVRGIHGTATKSR